MARGIMDAKKEVIPVATTTYGIYSGNRRKVSNGQPLNERIPGGAKKLTKAKTSPTSKGKKR